MTDSFIDGRKFLIKDTRNYFRLDPFIVCSSIYVNINLYILYVYIQHNKYPGESISREYKALTSQSPSLGRIKPWWVNLCELWGLYVMRILCWEGNLLRGYFAARVLMRRAILLWGVLFSRGYFVVRILNGEGYLLCEYCTLLWGYFVTSIIGCKGTLFSGLLIWILHCAVRLLFLENSLLWGCYKGYFLWEDFAVRILCMSTPHKSMTHVVAVYFWGLWIEESRWSILDTPPPPPPHPIPREQEYTMRMQYPCFF